MARIIANYWEKSRACLRCVHPVPKLDFLAIFGYFITSVQPNLVEASCDHRKRKTMAQTAQDGRANGRTGACWTKAGFGRSQTGWCDRASLAGTGTTWSGSEVATTDTGVNAWNDAGGAGLASCILISADTNSASNTLYQRRSIMSVKKSKSHR